MATVTIRPNSLSEQNGWTIIGGAGSINAALSDNLDATGARMAAGSSALTFFRVGFAAPGALPALSQIRSVTPRVRIVDPSPDVCFAQLWSTGTNLVQGGGPGGGVVGMWIPPAPTSATTFTLDAQAANPGGAAWREVDLGGLYLVVALQSGATAQGNYDVLEAYLDVLYNQAPVATITSASAFSNSRPTFTWTYTDPDGDPQERFWAKVFTPAQVAITGFSPDTSPNFLNLGETQSTAHAVACPSDLPDGSYTLYLKVADQGSGGRYSAWVSQSITITTSTTPAPTITAALDAAGARNLITVLGRANYLTTNQADVETNTAGFVAITNCSISRSTAQHANGVASLAMTATAGGTMQAGTPVFNATDMVPVATGYTFTAQCRIRANTTTRSCRLGVLLWDLAGSPVSTTWTSLTADSNSAWTTYTLTLTTPSSPNLGGARLLFEVQSAGAGEVHYVDMVGWWDGSGTTWTRGGLFSDILSAPNMIIESSDDAGVTWRHIRGHPFVWYGGAIYSLWQVIGAPLGSGLGTLTVPQQVQVYDYEAEVGVPRIYRARMSSTDPTLNVVLTSPVSSSTSPLTFTTDRWLLKDVLTPANNLPLSIRAYQFSGEQRVEKMGVFEPAGREFPVIVADNILGWDGTLIVTPLSAAEIAAVEAIFEAQNALYLQSESGESRYIRLLSPRALVQRFGPNARRYSAPFREVDSPPVT